jgi:predicted ATP-binding protein involved in virulence
MTENEKRAGYLKEHSRLSHNPNLPHLPFALSRIEIFDFQGIKHLIISNIPLNAQWIFLTGENGFGKTSILRAIAKGLVGDEEFVESLPKESRIYINGYNWNRPFSYVASPKKTADNDFQMAAYGVSRFRYHSDPEEVNPKTALLFSDEWQLFNIEKVLIEAERAKIEQKEKNGITKFDTLKKIFLEVIPQLADIKVEYIEKAPFMKRYQVRYYEKGEQSETLAPVKLNELAAGYRSILTMIGDMIIRLSAHSNNLLNDLQGIVLIDEIDAHLHPKYQYELPYLLSKVFPKVQFIVSTHSPIPILSLPKSVSSVLLTVSRTQKEGVIVDRKDDEMEIHRLNPNALFTSPVFGFQHLFARDATAQEIIPTHNYEDVTFIKEMKERLKTLRQQGLVK